MTLRQSPPLNITRLLALLVPLTVAQPAQAQSMEEKLRAQLRAVSDQLHQLEASQAGLLAQKAAAEGERDALRAKLAAGGAARPTPAAASPDEVKRLREENARLQSSYEQSQAEAAKFKAAYSQAAAAVQQTQGERNRFMADQSAASAALADCESKNIQLVKIGRDFAAGYQKLGVFDALARGEPLIGARRVRMERIAQDYGDKVYAAKFDIRAVKSAKPQSTTPPQAASNSAPTANSPAPNGPGPKS